MNTMLGVTPTALTGPWQTSLVVGYHAAMAVPVCDLDELQLGRFWSQRPSDEMLDVLIPTTIGHLRRDLFHAYGTPTFMFLARPEHFVMRPQHEPTLCALIEAWVPQLVEVLRDADARPSTKREVAVAALEVAKRYPSVLLAFETAFRAVHDHERVCGILLERARRAPNRIPLLVERARLFENNLDLEEAEYAWLDLLVDLPERAHDEVIRLFALDANPPWAYLVAKLREAAAVTPALRDELLRRAADFAATKLDEPETARAILADLR